MPTLPKIRPDMDAYLWVGEEHNLQPLLGPAELAALGYLEILDYYESIGHIKFIEGRQTFLELSKTFGHNHFKYCADNYTFILKNLRQSSLETYLSLNEDYSLVPVMANRPGLENVLSYINIYIETLMDLVAYVQLHAGNLAEFESYLDYIQKAFTKNSGLSTKSLIYHLIRLFDEGDFFEVISLLFLISCPSPQKAFSHMSSIELFDSLYFNPFSPIANSHNLYDVNDIIITDNWTFPRELANIS